MITLNQTAGDNNETIWVLKINTSTPILVSTKALTIADADENVITYDGQALNRNNYISDITQNSTVQGGGGTGSVSSYSFSISRYVNNTSLDGFFDEFYPNGTEYLTSKIVDLGIVWAGATLDTDITWLFRGRVIDYSYEQRQLNLTVFQESEISNKEIPYYSIQKDFNNGVSYYPNAPKESIGIDIPIVYGSFNIFNPVPNTTTGAKAGIALTPAYLVDPSKLEYIICSHQVKTISWNQHGKTGDTNLLFKYLSGVDNYMMCFKVGDSASSYSNSVVKYSFSFMFTISRIYADLYIQLTQVSGITTQSDVIDAIDDDPTTYSQIDRFEITATNSIALNIEGNESTSNVGYFKSDAGSISVIFAIKLEDDSTGNYRIGITNNTLATPASVDTGTVSMAGSTILEKVADLSGVTSIKQSTTLPWTIEELSDLEYNVINFGANTVGKKINVYYGYLKIININVTGSKLSGKGWIKTPNIRGTGTKVFIVGGFKR